MKANDCPGHELLQAYDAGDLPEDLASDVISHLSQCPACQAALQKVEEAEGSLVARLRRPEVEEHAAEPQCRDMLARVMAGGSPSMAELGETQSRSNGRRDDKSPVDIPSGTRLGCFVVERLLGWGSYGSVYLARDEHLQRSVAIKVPRWKPSATRNDLHRYLEEARTLAKLQHPGIAAVFDAGSTEDGVPYIVTQYIDGSSLKEWLKKNRPEPSFTATLLADISEAVHFAHRRGFTHRDLKPGNILLDSQGRPYVVDFGLALHEDLQRERVGESAGTLPYMAPEQVRGESHHLDGRADIWALGVILYEALTGRWPFRADNDSLLKEEILHREPRPPRQIDDRIPAELERICLKCLSKDITRRYSTAADLAKDLKGWLEPYRKFRRKVLWSLLALAACAVGVWVFWPAARSPLSPLEGSLDLLIWNKDDPSRRGLSVRDPQTLPLRANDQIRIQVELNRPAYLYVVWIDSRGKATPVYPWTPGHWEQRRENEKPSKGFSLPAVGDKGFPMEGPSGMEPLMLLARDEPLPDNVELRKYFTGLPPTHLSERRALIRFDQGKPIASAEDSQRAPDFSHPVQINDPVLPTQRLIQERVNQYFPLIRAVSVASEGAEKKP